jgi:VCBS repeat-containing protein
MAITTVSNSAGLVKALQVAHSGDTIRLNSGNYSGVVLTNLHFASNVTITSANPSHSAVLVGLSVGNSSGLVFTGLEMTSVGSTDPYYAFRVTSSNNISFTNVNVHGDPSTGASTQINGFYVTYSSGISFNNSTFSHINCGITANNDTNVNITGNDFSYLNKGGVELGGSSNVNILSNQFTDFQVSAGTHADAVQVYTAGTSSIASNINISGNEITRGDGDAIQGIFVADETGNLPYHNLVIDDNTVLGGMWDSIFVNANVTGNLEVNNNLAASWAGLNVEGAGTTAATTATAYATTAFLGEIALRGNLSGATVTERGNTAQAYITASGATIATPSGNVGVGSISAVTGTLNTTPVIAPAKTQSVHEFNSVSGNVLSGDSGQNLYLADVGIGAKGQTATVAGSVYTGTYGSLTVNPNGAYTYVEKNLGLTVGQVYDDHFTLTVASSNGPATSSTLDFLVTGSGLGDGAADTIVAGTGAETISGFGAGSILNSGSGPDTFVFSGVASSSPTSQTQVRYFKGGDVIDLSAVDPKFHIVTHFDGHADELVLAHIGTGSWEVYGDTTGSGTANFAIHLSGLSPTYSLTAANFHI